MEYRNFGSRYVIRLDRGEELVASLASLCSATCEMIVTRIDGVVERRLDEEVTGLNLFEFH